MNLFILTRKVLTLFQYSASQEYLHSPIRSFTITFNTCKKYKNVKCYKQFLDREKYYNNKVAFSNSLKEMLRKIDLDFIIQCKLFSTHFFQKIIESFACCFLIHKSILWFFSIYWRCCTCWVPFVFEFLDSHCDCWGRCWKDYLEDS